ncbi:hypothetical protein A374_16203 [Fictibacillus macauensis ZFHKF-1]|uniref:Uncharacterized protein n=1 Tax=Fictibacillus macauensis ZFHKF-1 TaxID=1196324 RepID=I8UBM7_9BACL|nr:hypothetical protein [Fictibacillus macauensis]EIT84345.1 hypothetical protein A374_16203 [Fictibacillus macauensis ZFHKF-1]
MMKLKNLGILLVGIILITFGSFKAWEWFAGTKEPATTTLLVDQEQRTKVKLPYGGIHSYTGNSRYLFFSANDTNKVSKPNKVIQYNRETKNYACIYTSDRKEANVQNVSANKEWVVWEEGQDQKPNAIYVKGIKTKTITPIRPDTKDVTYHHLALGRNHIAWIASNQVSKEQSLYVYDLINQTQKKIATLSTTEPPLVSVRNDQLLYVNEERFNMYSFFSEQTKTYPCPKKHMQRVKLLGKDKIVLLEKVGQGILDNRAFLYNYKKKQIIAFPKEATGIDGMEVDQHNVFLHKEDDRQDTLYKVLKNKVKKVGKRDSCYLKAVNGLYFYYGSDPLIVSNQRPH